jgi:lysyl-tRNA synthetase, class II
MTTLNEHETRLQKRQQLIDAGIPPYANAFQKSHSTTDLIKLSESYNLPSAELLMENGAASSFSTAGRVMMFRTHGKLAFIKLQDESGDIQLAFVKDQCKLIVNNENTVESILIEDNEISAFKFVEKYIDVADFIGAKGELFVTKHGELTLFVNEFQLLSKAVRPLGDKRHGIQDEEMIYRQRYLDMTMNRQSLERMKLRADFLRTLREFYWSHDFLELDTPILWNSASGAAATPFATHHEDFGADMYLRIAPEIALKIATVGGLEKVFEIGKDFRNEGSSPSHHQEFTVAEHYAAYWNFEDNMRFTEHMFDYLFEKLPQLSQTVMIADKEGVEREVNFKTPRQRIDYIEQIKKDSGIDVSLYGPDDAEVLRKCIKDNGFDRKGLDTQATATMIDYLYKKVTRPKIVWPAFIMNYPKTMQPLARQSDKNPNIVEQFQVIVNGWEILKAYSELVDPVIQQQNFDEQSWAVATGDSEATKSDDEFVLAMEHGMPCQSGRGMGIDRILAMLTRQTNIRDVIMFPMMKKIEWKVESEKSKEEIILPKQLPPYTNWQPTTDNWLQHMWKQDYWTLPTRSQADALASKYLTETLLHCQQVAKVMEAFAEKLWEDKDLRYMVGLLHDVDWDYIKKDGSKHLKAEFDTIMDEINAPQLMKDDIKSHGEWLTGVPVNSSIRTYLASIDELSGFLYAYSRMRPTGFDGMEVSGVKKRLKDKTFAAWVDREHVMHCEKYLGVGFDEFCKEVIGFMG